MISRLGRYEIIDELGRGAMGIVYKAKDPLIDRLVAVKTIDLKMLPETEKAAYGARFYQEAKAAGHLNHPNIVTIHDLGESSDVAYIAMELMEGRELQEILNGVKRMSVEDALYIASQVATGLHYAHKHGIVHRDIKPSNIMVLGDNLVKIADFGIATMPSSLKLTQDGMIVGSPLYMSPEQVLSKPIDARSDIFSLGVTLYQMLTWQLPFTADNANSLMYKIVNEYPPAPSSLNQEVPEVLDQIVAKCLAKDPAERYQDAKELAAELDSCRDNLLRAKAGLDHSLMTGRQLDYFKRLVIPGAVSQSFVAIGSYLLIALIFSIDLVTGATIQMHMLYIFPLIMVSFHCERKILVYISVILALFLQSVTLVMFDASLPTLSRLFIATLLLPSNIMISYVSRIARTNFLEVGNLTTFDRLTGLRNRLSFEKITDLEIQRQQHSGGVFSFVFIDLNNFKELNEARGFLVGDEVLKRVASVIREEVRQSDTASRLGGDEFAILMPNTGTAVCETLCRQLSGAIEASMKEAAFAVSTSIGYATFEQPPVSISEVFHKAEKAMLAAQGSGIDFAVNG